MQHPSDFGLNSNNRTRIPPVDRNSSADGIIIFFFFFEK